MTPMQIQNSRARPDFVTARAEFTLRATTTCPTSPRPSRGGRLFGSRRYDEALIDLDEAARLNPQSPRAHWNLGLAHCSIGRCAEGVRELRAASALTFGSPRPTCRTSAIARSLRIKTTCSDW